MIQKRRRFMPAALVSTREDHPKCFYTMKVSLAFFLFALVELLRKIVLDAHFLDGV